MNVAEAFALLLTSKRPESDSEVVTRRSGTATQSGDVLLGVDRIGRRHLLIPVPQDSSTSDRISRGITLDPRVLVLAGQTRLFADLVCQIPRLAPVFERLVEDLLERLEGVTAPLPVLTQTLEEWRSLVQKALTDLSRDTILGIIGELTVLRILAGCSSDAIKWWKGPTGSVHDFVRDGRAIEVKATGSVDGNRVRVSNLDQVDPAALASLHLAVVHLGPSADASSIDERIDELVEIGVPAIELEQALGFFGYVRGMSDHIDTRFDVRGIRWWCVSDEFPGLRSSDIDPQRLQAVEHVSYDLTLAAAPPALEEKAVEALLNEWTKA